MSARIPSDRGDRAPLARPDIDPDFVEQNLGFLLMRAFYDFKGLLQRQLKKHGLDEWMRPGMGPILFALMRKDNCIISEIGDELPLAPSTLTNTLKVMEEKGLVKVTQDKADRRAVRVRLTRRGRSLGPALTAVHEENRKVLTAGMSAEEVDQLKAQLTRVIESLALDAWEARHPGRKG